MTTLTLNERNELVTQHLSVARRAAAKFTRRGSSDFDDLFQEGCEGLMEAAGKYDPARGVPFGAYAAHYARRNVRYAAYGAGSAVRRPHALDSAAAYAPTDASLSVPKYEGGADRGDLLPSDADATDVVLGRLEVDARVRAAARAAVRSMSPRADDVLEQRMLAEDPVGLKEIGEQWGGKSKEIVRYYENKIKMVLKTRLAEFAADFQEAA